MNFVALIGIVNKIEVVDNTKLTIELKVEKSTPENDDKDHWYEMVKVIIDDTLDDYHDVVNNLKCGDIIGAKGHLMNNITVSDRIQIF